VGLPEKKISLPVGRLWGPFCVNSGKTSMEFIEKVKASFINAVVLKIYYAGPIKCQVINH